MLTAHAKLTPQGVVRATLAGVVVMGVVLSWGTGTTDIKAMLVALIFIVAYVVFRANDATAAGS